MDTEIRTLAATDRPIERCPVCGDPLVVMQATNLVGDDYGSWVEYDVYLACGHSFHEMVVALRHADD